MKIFNLQEDQKIREFFCLNGYVAVAGAVSNQDIVNGIKAMDQSVENGTLAYYDKEDPSGNLNQELYDAHPYFSQLAKHKNIVGLVRKLLDCDVELQHTKLSLKPLGKGFGRIEWHQDFPFFPHTNYDLVACSVLLDDVTLQSAPLTILPASHKLGVLDHYEETGEFAYQCTQMPEFTSSDLVPCIAPAGTIIFHHCLSLHFSEANIGSQQHRRQMVFQYRAKDAHQIAGVIRKCNGVPVDDSPAAKEIRFAVGDTMKLIGNRRNLFDLYGKFKPDH